MSSSFPHLSTSETLSVILRVALEHHERGRLQDAAALYREVLQIDPENKQAGFLLGLICTTAGHYAQAERLLTQAAERMPAAAHIHRALADVLSRMRRTGAALQSYWRALECDPHRACSYVDVGLALLAVKPKGGNQRIAASCFQRALQIDPSCSRAREAAGRLQRSSVVLQASPRRSISMVPPRTQAARRPLEVCPVR